MAKHISTALSSAECDSNRSHVHFQKAIKDPNWRTRANAEPGPDEDQKKGKHIQPTLRLEVTSMGKVKGEITGHVIGTPKPDENTQPRSWKCDGALGDLYPQASSEDSPTWSKVVRTGRYHTENIGSCNALKLDHKGLATVRRHVQIEGLAATGLPLSLIKLEAVMNPGSLNGSGSSCHIVDENHFIEVMHLGSEAASRIAGAAGSESRLRRAPDSGSLGNTACVEDQDAVERALLKAQGERLNQNESIAQQSCPTSFEGIGRPPSGITAADGDFLPIFPERASDPTYDASIDQVSRYDKLLEKLKREHLSDPVPVGAAHRHKSSSMLLSNTSEDTQIRSPQASRRDYRREISANFSGDSGYASISTNTSQRNRSLSGQSSRVHSESSNSVTTNRFNPLARDFLPLNNTKTQRDGSGPTRIPVTLESNAIQGNWLSHAAVQGCVSPLQVPALPLAAVPGVGGLSSLIPIGTSLFGGLTWPPGAGLNCLSALGLTPVVNSIQPPAVSSHSFGSTVDPLPSQDQGLATTLGSSFNLAPQSTARLLHNKADTQAPPLNDVPAIPPGHGQLSLVGHPQSAYPPPSFVHGPPRPVPKPRLPNAMAQNEYEAWIEHQKATRPGYALECKMRQQQRAQRKLQNQFTAASPRKGASETVPVAEDDPAMKHVPVHEQLCGSETDKRV